MLGHRVMRYVDAVARAGSIRRAAAQLNVASSAVNRQILALEAELGTPVFRRLPRRMQPTAAGEVLLAHIRQTAKDFDRARDTIDEMRGMRRGSVTIAAMSGPSGSIVPLVLDAFRALHPRAVANVRVLSGADIVSAVESGEADIGIAFDLPRNPRVRLLLSHDCTLGAVMRPSHPLAGSASLVLGDCTPFPLVIADSSMAIRAPLEALAERQALALDAAVETNSIEVMRRMTLAGDLVTFLTPIDILPELRAGQLVHVPFRDGLRSRQQLMLIGLDRAPSSLAGPLVEQFRALLDGQPPAPTEPDAPPDSDRRRIGPP